VNRLDLRPLRFGQVQPAKRHPRAASTRAAPSAPAGATHRALRSASGALSAPKALALAASHALHLSHARTLRTRSPLRLVKRGSPRLLISAGLGALRLRHRDGTRDGQCRGADNCQCAFHD